MTSEQDRGVCVCVCVTPAALGAAGISEWGPRDWDPLMLRESILPSPPPGFAGLALWGEGIVPSAPSPQLTHSVQPCPVSFL